MYRTKWWSGQINNRRCSLQSSVAAIDTQKTEETDELSERLKLYKAFLQDEISSEHKEDKESYYLRDFCNVVVPEKTEGGIDRYSLRLYRS